MNRKELYRKIKSQCKWGLVPGSTQCQLTVCKHECLKGTEFEGEKIK